jgi:hypothetical protein
MAAVICSCSSCLTSLHQLVTYDQVITDNRFAGQWRQDNNAVFKIEDLLKSNYYNNTASASVHGKPAKPGFDSREDSLLYSKSYVISFAKSGYDYTMIASLMRLGDNMYADFIPVAVSKTGSAMSGSIFDGSDYMISHSIAKIIFTGGNMEIKFLNDDFIGDQLQKGTLAIKYEYDPTFKTTLVTAPSAWIRQFLLKYGDMERLYSSENTIILKKI